MIEAHSALLLRFYTGAIPSFYLTVALKCFSPHS